MVIVAPQHAAALSIARVYYLCALCVLCARSIMTLLMVVIMPKMQMGVGMGFAVIMIMMVGMYEIGIEE